MTKLPFRLAVVALIVAVALAIVLLVGCVPPLPPPVAPTALRVAHNTADVVRIAARELLESGFEIAVSDADGGILSAKKRGRGKAALSFAQCRWPSGSIGELTMTAVLTVSVSARKAPADSSDVLIRGEVRSATDMGTENAEDCVSNGEAEHRISAALTRPPLD